MSTHPSSSAVSTTSSRKRPRTDTASDGVVVLNAKAPCVTVPALEDVIEKLSPAFGSIEVMLAKQKMQLTFTTSDEQKYEVRFSHDKKGALVVFEDVTTFIPRTNFLDEAMEHMYCMLKKPCLSVDDFRVWPASDDCKKTEARFYKQFNGQMSSLQKQIKCNYLAVSHLQNVPTIVEFLGHFEPKTLTELRVQLLNPTAPMDLEELMLTEQFKSTQRFSTNNTVTREQMLQIAELPGMSVVVKKITGENLLDVVKMYIASPQQKTCRIAMQGADDVFKHAPLRKCLANCGLDQDWTTDEDVFVFKKRDSAKTIRVDLCGRTIIVHTSRF